MKFLRTALGYSKYDRKINLEICEELRVEELNCRLQNYMSRDNWKTRSKRMTSNKIPKTLPK